MLKRASIILLVLSPACAKEEGLICGEGTHEEEGACVPDEDTERADTGSETGEGADTEPERDTENIFDTGDSGDTESPADTDTGEPLPKEDEDGDGWSAAEDCDDQDALVHPGASEICENGTDDDCDGTAGPCAWSGEVRLDSGIYELRGDRYTDQAGLDVAVGDYDGDGDLDAAISAPYNDQEAEDAGVIYILEGPLTETVNLYESDWILASAVAGERAGTSIATVPDLDGDGADELWIGAPEADLQTFSEGDGAAYLLSGSSGSTLIGEGALLYSPEDPGGIFGVDVAAGDLTGDGVADLVVTSPGNTTYTNGSGAAYVFSGASAAPTRADAAEARIYGDESGGASLVGIGHSAAAPGDLNGDGIGDLLVAAASYYDEDLDTDSAVFVFLGPVSGTRFSTDADYTLYAPWGTDVGLVPNGLSGIGDLDGDGYQDFAAGDPEYQSTSYYNGKVYGVGGGQLAGFSGVEDLFLAEWSLEGESYSATGYAVGGAGDVNGDGADDLLISAPFTREFGDNSGAVMLFYGPVSGALGRPDIQATFLGTEENWWLGKSMARGELTGDGIEDLLLGAPTKESGASFSGAAILLPAGGY